MDCTMSRSRCSSRFIAQVLLVVLCALMTSSSACQFPTFMSRIPYWYSQVTERRIGAMWQFPTPDQAERTDLTSRSRPKTTFSCHTAIDQDTFLTSVTASEEDSSESTSSYQCLRFVRRSDFVVQLAKSDVFDTASPDDCRDSGQLTLQDWILVYPHRDEGRLTGVLSCGLVGGYWLSIMDSSGTRTCQDSFLQPIIESDCISPGQGVLIDFRQPTCQPASTGTEVSHELVCLGSWTQSESIYSVVSDGKSWPTVWLLKIPEGASGPITTRLMRSLSTGSAQNSTAHQYALSLTPASFPTLCENEASRCNVTACVDDSTEVHCQKMCEACTVVTSEISCQFNESYHGQWIEMSRRYDADDVDTVETVCIQAVYIFFLCEITDL